MKGLVICINRCRPDFLGCYGNDWVSTPAFDELAAAGVVFDQHFCSDLSTRPPAWNRELGPLLQARGVYTALLGDERSLMLSAPFAEGWSRRQCVASGDLAGLEQTTLLGGTVQTAVNWLDELRRKDEWLFWLEFSSLHMPWNASESDNEADGDHEPALPNRYAGMVGFADDWLGQMVEYLKEQGMYDDLLLIVTGDIGLPLGEHGSTGDEKVWPHEEMIHLPLLIHLPGGAEAGRRVPALTQSIDLLPTLCLAFGADNAGLERNLLALVGEKNASKGGPIVVRSNSAAAIRTPQWHLILPASAGGSSGAELYYKPEDRWEVNNVATLYPEVVEELENQLGREPRGSSLPAVSPAPSNGGD